MAQIYGGPGKYIQGYGELKNVQQHIAFLGKKFLLLASKNRMKDRGQEMIDHMDSDFEIIKVEFNGESSWAEVERVAEIGRAEGIDAIIGMGGGKVIDTAKTASDKLKCAMVIIPTIAASDACVGSLAVIYNEDGSLDQEVHFNKNPEIVIVDTEVIMNAPVRFLVSGMGDALSTYFGAKVAYEQYQPNEYGGLPTEASMALSRLSYDLLLKHGLAAKVACEQKVMTKDLEKIIETNVLLSGLGMESSGAASDHTFYYAFCELTHRHEYMYHGEYVAFSTLCMLVMMGASKETIDEVERFCISVGLPVTLEDMRLHDLTDEEWKIVTNSVLAQDGPKRHPFKVTEADALAAIKTADAIGKLYKEEGKSLLV